MRTIAAAAALLAIASAAAADTPRLQRVVLLPVAGRVSIVLEMSGPPASVTSRRISGDLVEVDAGPALVDHPQALTIPAATPLVSMVLIDSTGTATGTAPTLRARITLRDAAESAVRIQGTRVYIDFSNADTGSAPSLTPAVAAPRAHSQPAVPARAAVHTDDERAKLAASMERFGELLPFLTSAASAPTPQVLAALAAPTASLARSVDGLSRAGTLGPAEGLFASAMAAAVKAADESYRGDRMEQIRQAAIFFDQARREMAPAEPQN